MLKSESSEEHDIELIFDSRHHYFVGVESPPVPVHVVTDNSSPLKFMRLLLSLNETSLLEQQPVTNDSATVTTTSSTTRANLVERSGDRLSDVIGANLDEFIGDYSRYVNFHAWPVLFLSVFIVLGFTGNLLVCLAIKLDTRLQNATNYYLFSLATTDLLVSIIVIPVAIVKSLLHQWILGNVICTLWVFFDVFLCTNSIMLLCVIACERYIGIRDPLKNRDRSKSKTRSIIFLIWILSSLLSCPILVLAYIDPANVLVDSNCALQNHHFIIYGSIISFIFPLVIMIVVYCLTVQRLHRVVQNCKLNNPKNSTSMNSIKDKQQQQRSPPFNLKFLARFTNRKKDNKTTTSSPANQTAPAEQQPCLGPPKTAAQKRNSFIGLRRSVNSNSSITSNRVNGLNSSFAILNLKKTLNNAGLNSSLDEKKLSMAYLSPSVSPSKPTNSSTPSAFFSALSNHTAPSTPSPTAISGGLALGLGSANTGTDNISGTTLGAGSAPGSVGAKRFAELVNKRRLINRAVNAFQATRESNRVKNEQKAVKVLGVVFVVFVIAWVPFAIANILSAVCDLTTRCSIHSYALTILSWLGYISSSINPLIYNAINERFRFAFKMILTCRWHALKKRQLANVASTSNKLMAAKMAAQDMLTIQPSQSRLSSLRELVASSDPVAQTSLDSDASFTVNPARRLLFKSALTKNI